MSLLSKKEKVVRYYSYTCTKKQMLLGTHIFAKARLHEYCVQQILTLHIMAYNCASLNHTAVTHNNSGFSPKTQCTVRKCTGSHHSRAGYTMGLLLTLAFLVPSLSSRSLSSPSLSSPSSSPPALGGSFLLPKTLSGSALKSE